MSTIPNDPNAIVEAAIVNEIEGHRILEQGKKAANTPLAKATFEFLANEELKHIDLIKDFAKTLEGVKEWDPSELKELSLSEAGRHIRGIFERFGAQFEEVAATDNERLETYKVAMDMEHRGHDFYAKAAEQVTDERAKKLFQYLADEEVKHFEIIQDTHDFLAQPDAILAMEERWMQT
jgi:rubrerythrin